jgi:RNA polymerase primary sigma factor
MGHVSHKAEFQSDPFKASGPNPMKTKAARRSSAKKNVKASAGSPVLNSRSVDALNAAPVKTGAEHPLRDIEEALRQQRNAPLDAFTLYMREVGLTPLLSPEEEISLARRIKKGDREARDLMIRANLRLVVKIARDYENAGLPLLDLVSEGNIGLMTAVERFDPKKGAKLSTYAAFWIKQSIRRALANQAKTIRLPVHVVDKLFHIRRAEAKMRGETGIEPTDQELSVELGISTKRIASYRSASATPSSLDALLGESGDSGSFSDIVPDEKALTPYRQLEEKTDTLLVREAVESLDARERAILNARFGLDGEEGETLDEIGHKLGVTRERIRQIQEIALAKLRRRIEKVEAVQEVTA